MSASILIHRNNFSNILTAMGKNSIKERIALLKENKLNMRYERFLLTVLEHE